MNLLHAFKTHPDYDLIVHLVHMCQQQMLFIEDSEILECVVSFLMDNRWPDKTPSGFKRYLITLSDTSM